MQNNFMRSSDYRFRARQSMKPNLSALLMLTFLASLPGLITSTVRVLTQASLMQTMNSLYVELTSALMRLDTVSMEAIQQRLMRAMTQYYASGAGIATVVCSLVAGLITPALTLGLLASLIRLLRNGPVASADVFSRMGIFLRALWLTILRVLKMLLWALPGYGLIILTAILAAFADGFLLGTLLMLGSLGGLALLVILVVRAALHYSMAEYVLADHPELKASQALRESLRVMSHRKLAYVELSLSFIGWYFLSSFIQMMLTGMSPVLGMVASLAMQLVLSLYVNTSHAAFYLHQFCGEVPPVAEQQTEDKAL